ncbi:hypothetical protein [Hydrogenimonas sp.]
MKGAKSGVETILEERGASCLRRGPEGRPMTASIDSHSGGIGSKMPRRTG